MKLRYQFFTDNDLTHITDDHIEIKLVARLLDQIYVVPSPQSPLRYDDTLQDPMTFTQTVNSTSSPMTSAPMLSLHMLINPTYAQESAHLYTQELHLLLHLYHQEFQHQPPQPMQLTLQMVIQAPQLQLSWTAKQDHHQLLKWLIFQLLPLYAHKLYIQEFLQQHLFH